LKAHPLANYAAHRIIGPFRIFDACDPAASLLIYAIIAMLDCANAY
jgi:hypothetical protein